MEKSGLRFYNQQLWRFFIHYIWGLENNQYHPWNRDCGNL